MELNHAKSGLLVTVKIHMDKRLYGTNEK